MIAPDIQSEAVALEERLARTLLAADCSEQELCVRLSCAPEALQFARRDLEAAGFPIVSDASKWFLRWRPALLDVTEILQKLTPRSQQHCRRIDCVWATDSTNQRLLERWHSGAEAHGNVYLSERQTSGRGRQGRTWISPLGGGLCLSVGWRMPLDWQRTIGLLGIAAAIAAGRCLRAIGVDCRIKWPNDLQVAGKKLGGVLVETARCGEALGVVVGYGINVDLRGITAAAIDQAYTDLACSLSVIPSRSHLTAQLINSLVSVFASVCPGDSSDLIEQWRTFDAIHGKRVRVHSGGEVVDGIAEGIGPDGALRLTLENEQRYVYAGEILLREST